MIAAFQEKFRKFDRSYLQVAGILLLLLLAVFLLWFNKTHSNQAVSAIAAQVRFEGEYRIGDGPWQNIVKGQHISAMQGDVTLRGNFHMLTPDGEYVGLYSGDTPIAFYTNHISLTIREGENEPFTFSVEYPLLGESFCGAYWEAFAFTEGNEKPIELIVHNPHRFGNETAVDELLANFAFWGGLDFEKSVLDSGRTQRNTGLLFVIVAFVLLGSALFSALLHIQNTHIIWLLGSAVLTAGIYLAYSAPGTPFWSEFVTVNTTILGASMMFYMLFISGIIAFFLQKTKRICSITTALLGVAIGACLLLSLSNGIRFYDTWLPWAIIQSAANVVFLFCLVSESLLAGSKERLVYGGILVLILAFEADIMGTALGYWKGGMISQYAFFVWFVAALFVVLRLLPENINAAAKARELEAEKNIVEAQLKESRISIMLSQIQPHFIYNTLGTIERMCLKDPEKAFQLVRNFSLYLRGNFSELDSVTPIRFTEELKHVEHYVNIEKVRFPDMTIRYEVETTDFILPALSVQPLVENAIKHGLMRLESGGTVVIRSYETATHFCVEVKDDGVGFDPTLPMDEKKHVGLRNIRGRLNAMVKGELILESQVNVGTKATILIPKEVTV